MDPFFELLKLDSGKLAGTDVPQPLKPLAEETVTDLGLARSFQRYDVCGLLNHQSAALQVGLKLGLGINEFGCEDFCALFDELISIVIATMDDTSAERSPVLKMMLKLVDECK